MLDARSSTNKIHDPELLATGRAQLNKIKRARAARTRVTFFYKKVYYFEGVYPSRREHVVVGTDPVFEMARAQTMI